MFIDLNDINEGLDLIYGKGKKVVNRAAKQAVNKVIPNVSGYRQMVQDTFPKGYNAVNNLTRAIQQAPDVQGKAKVVRSAYNQMLKDTAPKVDANTQRIAKDLATKITGVSPDKQIVRAVQKKLTNPTVSNVATTTAKTGGKMGLKEFIPFVGDSALMAQGWGDIKSGHPYVGAGRIGIGGLGMVLDAATIGELLATPLTGGASTAGAVATQAGKQALKKSALGALEKAIAKGASINTGKNATKRFIAGEALGLLKNNGNSNTAPQETKDEFFDDTQTGNIQKAQPIGYGYAVSPNLPQGPMSVEEFTRLNGGQYNNSDGYQLPQLPTVAQPGGGIDVQQLDEQPISQGSGNNLDLSQILELYREMNRANEPYLERLQEYSKRYPELQGEAFNRDRYLAAMSGLAENPAYQRMIGRYNPAEIEAQQIDLEGKISAQRQKQLEDLMELMGNATIANELNLPATAAMANKNLLNTYTGMGKAQLGLQGKMYSSDRSAQAKMYVADRISKAKEYDTYIDNQIKMSIAQGNWQNARQLQQMKNDNRIQTSIITGIPFADINQLFDGTNALGVTDINTTGLGGNIQPGGNMQYFN